jgi:hypothetical protein
VQRVVARADQAVAKVVLVVEKAAPVAVRMVPVAPKVREAERALHHVPSAQSDLREARSTTNAVRRRTLSDPPAGLDPSVPRAAPARRVPSVQ